MNQKAPLFLASFQFLSYLPDIFISLTYIATDLLLAYLLSETTRIKQELYKDLPRVDIELVEGKAIPEIDSWIVAGL